MNNRYEILQNELKYQTADSMAVLEILEKLSNDNRIATDIRDLKNVVSQRMQRLNNQFIPQQSNFASHIPGQQQQQQHGNSVSSNYHLESTNVSRNPSTTNLNVAPQPYPLNPHYTIYANNRALGVQKLIMVSSVHVKTVIIQRETCLYMTHCNQYHLEIARES